MPISKDFFALQLAFAERIAEVSRRTVAHALWGHTALREVFGLRTSHNDVDYDPRWQHILERIGVAPDKARWVHQHYLACRENTTCNQAQPWFGCFSYAISSRHTGAIRLHFQAGISGRILSRESESIRIFELRSMFKEIQRSLPEAKTVRGGSWLYNISAYTRLFPPRYIETATPAGYETDSLALWGQFLRANGQLREPSVASFLKNLRRHTTVKDCLRCFPYQVLRPDCSIQIFYDYYGIARSSAPPD